MLHEDLLAAVAAGKAWEEDADERRGGAIGRGTRSSSITVEGQEVHDPDLDKLALRRKVGMVFQQFNLFPHMDALQNVMEAPVSVLGLPKADARDQAAAYLERVGLGDKLHAYPRELSGGQQQRVALARAMVLEPSLLLADEPTGNLDTRASDEVAGLLRQVFESLGPSGGPHRGRRWNE